MQKLFQSTRQPDMYIHRISSAAAPGSSTTLSAAVATARASASYVFMVCPGRKDAARFTDQEASELLTRKWMVKDAWKIITVPSVAETEETLAADDNEE